MSADDDAVPMSPPIAACGIACGLASTIGWTHMISFRNSGISLYLTCRAELRVPIGRCNNDRNDLGSDKRAELVTSVVVALQAVKAAGVDPPVSERACSDAAAVAVSAELSQDRRKLGSLRVECPLPARQIRRAVDGRRNQTCSLPIGEYDARVDHLKRLLEFSEVAKRALASARGNHHMNPESNVLSVPGEKHVAAMDLIEKVNVLLHNRTKLGSRASAGVVAIVVVELLERRDERGLFGRSQLSPLKMFVKTWVQQQE